MELPASAALCAEGVLAQIDNVVPGLVDGAYVTGSLALGDYHPEISDIDLVAVCGRRPREAELDALEPVHRPSRPNVDVLYVTWDDLRTDPSDLSTPQSLQGVFHRDGAFAANPVEWRTLQTRAIPIRGPGLRDADVWFDSDVLRRWNLKNLEDYWAGRLDCWRRVDPDETVTRHQHGLQWLVLGVPRLHHTITTLDIASKTQAGHYALGLVGRQWHPVIEAGIALRSDRAAPLTLSPEELRGQAVALGEWLIADARRLLTN